MTLTINTNIPSIIAQRSLNNATNLMNKSIERMTTGYKINHSADNAAGYSISEQWVTKLGSLEVATSNASMGADMLTTAEESYSLLASHLQRVRDLTEQAANGTYGTQSLRAIQSEIHARVQEINRIGANIEYNGVFLMDGSITEDIDLQVGLYAASSSQITLSHELFGDASMNGLFKDQATPEGGVAFDTLMQNGGASGGKADLGSDDATTKANALQAFAAACVGMKYDTATHRVVKQTATDPNRAKDLLAYIDAAIDDISERTTRIGAAQNRVTSAIDSIDVQSQNLTSSLSSLRDTDVASESSKYIQAQILQQASSTLLSTANQLPSIALNLI